MSNLKLKPCPFCGGKAEMSKSAGDSYAVICTSCYCFGERSRKMNYATRAWNKRSTGWISVKDRLLEEVDGESKAVLVIVKFVDFRGNVWSENYNIAWTENGEWDCIGRMGIVTHWMPLPEPPEKEKT